MGGFQRVCNSPKNIYKILCVVYSIHFPGEKILKVHGYKNKNHWFIKTTWNCMIILRVSSLLHYFCLPPLLLSPTLPPFNNLAILFFLGSNLRSVYVVGEEGAYWTCRPSLKIKSVKMKINWRLNSNNKTLQLQL